MFNEFVLSPVVRSIDKFPNRNCFLINEQFYTYSQFANHISGIRKQLRLYNNKGKNIGLVVNDDIETYASIFAIWLEGLAYIPLHPHQPVERSYEIIAQSQVYLVMDSSPETIYVKAEVLCSKGVQSDQIDLKPVHEPESSLAYILFTSGSTGTPKGVAITRNNVGAFMKSFWETGITVDENDRCLQSFDLTFDVSVQCYLTPLTKGACTYTIPHNQIKYSYVFGLLEEHQLTFGAMAPSMIRYLRPYFEEINISSMHTVILTAEASPLDLVTEWSGCIPNATIYDFYGPTEATIYCTYNKFFREANNKQLNGMLSIGKPMPGVMAIVTDENQKVLTTNQKGELCIAGSQLTPGYWNNEEKNKTSFFELNIDGLSTRFYRTGDSCYFDEDGDIMLSGRLDHQVKIQGYRVELGEIEHHAREFLKGQNAVAIAFTNQLKNTEIALFIEGMFSEKEKMLSYLNSKMPFYMVPTRLIIEESFPINTSGKVDRIKLKGRLQS